MYKHPPSKTIGRKYWLAKAMKPIETYFSKEEYGFSPASFDPKGMTIGQARVAGKDTSLWKPYGRLLGAQIWRMAHEVNIGDVIFLEIGNRDIVAWGTITGPYKFEALKKPTHDSEIHSIAVKWHKVKNGKEAFRSGKGDNLCLREITERENLLPILKKFIDGPLPEENLPTTDRDDSADIEYKEGNKVLRTHLSTERDTKVVKLAKELARKKSETGNLTCESCNCTPEDDYHKVGLEIDIIEAHHRIPLAKGKRNTKPSDFCMLCPAVIELFIN
jgi:hypothetical protein